MKDVLTKREETIFNLYDNVQVLCVTDDNIDYETLRSLKSKGLVERVQQPERDFWEHRVESIGVRDCNGEVIGTEIVETGINNQFSFSRVQL